MRVIRGLFVGALALAAWLFIADLWWSAAQNDWQLILFFNQSYEAIPEGVIIFSLLAVIVGNIILDLKSLGKRE